MADIEAAEKKWSATANLYIRYFEQCTVAIGCNMLSAMNLRFCSNPLRVIECGSGAGGLGIEIIRILTADEEMRHSITMVDLSETMMGIASTRVAPFSASLDIQTRIGDATCLDIPDCSYDRYVCNMTIHYAPDADSFLREAVRVLAPGGVAGFTVWGRDAASPAMALPNTVKAHLGLKAESTAPSRSSHHMGEDDGALRARVLAAGFSQCTVWHAPGVVEAQDVDRYLETMLEGSYSTKQEMAGWTDEQQYAFREALRAAAKEVLDRGEPLALDVCYFIATKQMRSS
jgi:SAM-dependent methyltransferase